MTSRILVCFALLVGMLGCTGSSEPDEFHSYAMVQILRSQRSNDAIVDSIMTSEDINTIVATASSYSLKKRYWGRIKEEGISSAVVSPYSESENLSDDVAFRIFSEKVQIIPKRLSLIIDFGFIHTDPFIAKRVSDLIALEFVAYEGEVAGVNPDARVSRLISEAFIPEKTFR